MGPWFGRHAADRPGLRSLPGPTCPGVRPDRGRAAPAPGGDEASGTYHLLIEAGPDDDAVWREYARGLAPRHRPGPDLGRLRGGTGHRRQALGRSTGRSCAGGRGAVSQPLLRGKSKRCSRLPPGTASTPAGGSVVAIDGDLSRGEPEAPPGGPLGRGSRRSGRPPGPPPPRRRPCSGKKLKRLRAG